MNLFGQVYVTFIGDSRIAQEIMGLNLSRVMFAASSFFFFLEYSVDLEGKGYVYYLTAGRHIVR